MRPMAAILTAWRTMRFNIANRRFKVADRQYIVLRDRANAASGGRFGTREAENSRLMAHEAANRRLEAKLEMRSAQFKLDDF